MLPSVQNIPSLPSATPVPAGLGMSNASFDANIVPTIRQSVHGLTAQQPPDSMARDHLRQHMPVISHPRQAPSAITTEQFLAARSMGIPAFKHNILATKMARISNLMAQTPRFHDQLDILA